MFGKIFLISKLYSLITEGIELIEAISQDKPGEEKLKEALDIIEPSLQILFSRFNILDKDKEKLLRAGIPEIISGSVKIFHAIGIFKQKN